MPCGSFQVKHPQLERRTRQMGGMGNVVVTTIVRMFTRKAVGKAMKFAKKSTGAGKDNE